MPGKNYSLASAVPEQDSFTDRDGTRYDVQGAMDLSEIDYITMNRWQATIEEVQKNAKLEDPEEAARAMTSLLQAVNGFMKILIPGMPETRIGEMKLREKLDFIMWWQAQQPKPEQSPNRAARRAAGSNQKRSLRGSSGSTTSTR